MLSLVLSARGLDRLVFRREFLLLLLNGTHIRLRIGKFHLQILLDLWIDCIACVV